MPKISSSSYFRKHKFRFFPCFLFPSKFSRESDGIPYSSPASQQASLEEISPPQSLVDKLESLLHELLIKRCGSVDLEHPIHTIRSSALKIQFLEFLLHKPEKSNPNISKFVKFGFFPS